MKAFEICLREFQGVFWNWMLVMINKEWVEEGQLGCLHIVITATFNANSTRMLNFSLFISWIFRKKKFCKNLYRWPPKCQHFCKSLYLYSQPQQLLIFYHSGLKFALNIKEIPRIIIWYIFSAWTKYLSSLENNLHWFALSCNHILILWN